MSASGRDDRLTPESTKVARPVTYRRIVASVCTALLLLLASCDVGKNSDSHRGGSQPPSNAVCLDAQRAAFPGLVDGWRKLAIAMTAGDNGAPPNPLEPWTS
ncbi:MAG TPA: hypothetical protein VF086_04200, partial [Propionibacteriaceae bacterium]